MAHVASIFDKYAVAQKLQKRGFSHDQAEGIAEALASVDLSDLATKNDLKDLELRLYKHLAGILIAHGLGTAALTVALLQLLR
jgi:sulfite reductase beta subunit-like hemoprotein